jgi:hypothetical protein
MNLAQITIVGILALDPTRTPCQTSGPGPGSAATSRILDPRVARARRRHQARSPGPDRPASLGAGVTYI